MLPTLENLLRFRHDASIKNYMHTYKVDQAKAEQLFIDMLKYLWVSSKHRYEREQSPLDPSLNFNFVMHQEMRDIDNMWHGFILYTQDYMNFCTAYFGTYLHHAPDVAEGEGPSEEEFTRDMANYLSYVYDHLGEATLKSWFRSYVEDT